MYFHNLGQKVVEKLTKSRKIEFSMACFTAIFYQKMSKCGFWLAGCVLAGKYKLFRNFPWDFLSLKLLVKFYFLVIII